MCLGEEGAGLEPGGGRGDSEGHEATEGLSVLELLADLGVYLKNTQPEAK